MSSTPINFGANYPNILQDNTNTPFSIQNMTTGNIVKVGTNQLISKALLGGTGINLTETGSSVTINSTGGVWNAQTEQAIFVGGGGSDTNNGGPEDPVATIAHAFSMIAGYADASPSKRYTIVLYPGNWSSNISIPANIFIAGIQSYNTRLTGNVDMNSSTWVDVPGANDNRSGFSNVTFTGSVTFDFAVQSSGAGKIYLHNIRSNNVITLNAFRNINQFYLQDSFLFAGISQSGVVSVVNMCKFINGGTVALTSNTNCLTQLIMDACGSDGPLTLTYTAANPYTVSATLTSSPFTAVTVTGASASLSATSDSLPIRADVTVSGGATLTLLNDAAGEAYTPVTPADWGFVVPVPATVQQALDDISHKITNGLVASVTAGTNVTVTGTAQNPIINATGGGGSGTVTSVNNAAGATNSQVVAPFTTTPTVLGLAAGTGIGIASSASNNTISNTGVTSLTAGSGVGVSGSTGSVTISNTGVNGVTAGSGISVTGTTQNPIINATGGGAGNVLFQTFDDFSGGYFQAAGISISPAVFQSLQQLTDLSGWYAANITGSSSLGTVTFKQSTIAQENGVLNLSIQSTAVSNSLLVLYRNTNIPTTGGVIMPTAVGSKVTYYFGFKFNNLIATANWSTAFMLTNTFPSGPNLLNVTLYPDYGSRSYAAIVVYYHTVSSTFRIDAVFYKASGLVSATNLGTAVINDYTEVALQINNTGINVYMVNGAGSAGASQPAASLDAGTYSPAVNIYSTGAAGTNNYLDLDYFGCNSTLNRTTITTLLS